MKTWTPFLTLLVLGLLTTGCRFNKATTKDLRTGADQVGQSAEAEDEGGGKTSDQESKGDKARSSEMGRFPPNGSFALQFSNYENPNGEFIVSEDPFLKELGSRWMQIQDAKHSGTASLYLQINAGGDYRLIYWAGEDLGYVDVTNGDLLICGRYNPYGSVLLEALGCKAVGNLSQIQSSYDVVYENGGQVRSGNIYYYDDGDTFISSNGTWYFRDGDTLKNSSGTFFWPSGYTLKSPSSGTWNYRDGSSLKHGEKLYYYTSYHPFADGLITQYANGDDMLGTSTHNLIYWGKNRYITSNGDILDFDGDYIKSGSDIFWDDDTYKAPIRRSVRRSFNGDYIHVDIEASKTSDFIVITEHESDASGGSYFLMRKDGSTDIGTEGYAAIDVLENGGVTRIPNGGLLDVGADTIKQDEASEPFLIQNEGLSDLVINNIEVLAVGDADDTDMFGVRGVNFPRTVSPGEDISAAVAMDRSQARSGRVKIRITSNDTANPVWEFTVMGSVFEKMGDGLTGRYFDNISLSGSPKVTRVDKTVTFDWEKSSPASAIPVDAFSARWDGQVYAPFSGEYRFFVRVDDGARLWVNNQLIVDDWVPNPIHESSGTIVLEAGKRYDLKLEYFESPGFARVYLGWSPPEVGPGFITTPYLFTTYVPNAPRNFAASAVSSAAIKLSWEDASLYETSYVIQQSSDGLNFSTIASLPEDTTSHYVDGLLGGTTYHFRVYAANAEGDSSTVDAVIETQPLPPVPDMFTAMAVDAQGIRLDWNDSSPYESGFVVERSVDGTSFADLVVLAANAVSYQDTGLEENSTYFYRLRASGAGGDSMAVTTQATTMTLPAAPGNFSLTAISSTALRLDWQDQSDDETSFRIFRSENGVDYALLTTVSANVTTYTNSALDHESTYFYRIMAISPGGSSAVVEGEKTTLASSTTSDPIDVPPTPSVSADGWLEAYAVMSVSSRTPSMNPQVSLPASQTWVDEWTSYRIEIWLKRTAVAPAEHATLRTIVDYDAVHATPGIIAFAHSHSSFSGIDDVNGSLSVDVVMDTQQMDIGKYYLAGFISMDATADDVDLPVASAERLSPTQITYQFLGTRVATAEPAEYALDISSLNIDRWPVPYDVNDSGTIDFRDLSFLAAVYGKTSGPDYNYSYAFDFDRNGMVNYRDLTYLAAVYGGKREDWRPAYPTNYPDL